MIADLVWFFSGDFFVALMCVGNGYPVLCIPRRLKRGTFTKSVKRVPRAVTQNTAPAASGEIELIKVPVSVSATAAELSMMVVSISKFPGLDVQR